MPWAWPLTSRLLSDAGAGLLRPTGGEVEPEAGPLDRPAGFRGEARADRTVLAQRLQLRRGPPRGGSSSAQRARRRSRPERRPPASARTFSSRQDDSVIPAGTSLST